MDHVFPLSGDRIAGPIAPLALGCAVAEPEQGWKAVGARFENGDFVVYRAIPNVDWEGAEAGLRRGLSRKAAHSIG